MKEVSLSAALSAELAEIDLENRLFAAVRVPLIYVKKFYSNPDPKDPDYLRFQYSLRFSECGYYNIGVCFVNLKKWKELDFGGRILAAQEKYPEIQQPGVNIPVDEMLFNLTLLYDIGEAYALPIPPKFNCVIHYMPYPKAVNSSMYCGYMNRRELIEAYYHAVSVHFCIFKPWNTDMYSRYWPELKAYIEKSPWPHPYTQEYFVGFILKVYRRFIYPIPFNWPKAIMIPLAKMIKKRLK
jgi:lipopolysaccharide biosynthesis glycosyltransferase